MFEKAMNLIGPDTSPNRPLLLSPMGVRINQFDGMVLLDVSIEYLLYIERWLLHYNETISLQIAAVDLLCKT